MLCFPLYSRFPKFFLTGTSPVHCKQHFSDAVVTNSRDLLLKGLSSTLQEMKILKELQRFIIVAEPETQLHMLVGNHCSFPCVSVPKPLKIAYLDHISMLMCLRLSKDVVSAKSDQSKLQLMHTSRSGFIVQCCISARFSLGDSKLASI